MKPPHTIINNHCHILGTTRLAARKNRGKPTLQVNRNQCSIVYSLDYLSLNISELTQPSSSPGRNSQSLYTEQFSYINNDPSMMAPKNNPYIFILCPRVTSQQIAKSTPPEPFHPRYILLTMDPKETTHSIFSLLSSGASGRQGQSPYCLMMNIQFRRKAKSEVTKIYCKTGIFARSDIQKCTMIKIGAKMSKAGLLRLSVGYSPLYLQVNQVSGV